ncbi:unnamed protein product [Vitrella brassicaformis CCMP3155]|uniref:Dynamin N-terminal domain-containing protein n=1 Tax=Vitrella brassicaformis (strain CCMP3155) TaxID=1169540 RepID=A0A0G4E9W7_VITBC|nr:unnamed protein product [Vitrella brassicaformis CCMP3155]|eukprot:CEL92720.1 unnamed protein product [Vitrella brassicaformis CCMP3155]
MTAEIMRELCALYHGSGGDTTDSDPSAQDNQMALAAIGRRVGVGVSLPFRERAMVMVLGNISAGKSTLINWLIGEPIQKTGMGIETRHFAIVTKGVRTSSELAGVSTVELFPQLRHIADKHPGFTDALICRTCPSESLSLVDFIDTPGLTDGDVDYGYDIDGVLDELAHQVDLILVMLDPVTQALNKRTLSVVQRIHKSVPNKDKLRFLLSKVDEMPTEEERIKVLCQTTQMLTSKIDTGYAFDLMPIYIPGAKDSTYLLSSHMSPNSSPLTVTTKSSFNDDQPTTQYAATASGAYTSQIANRIQDLHSEIMHTIDRRVQTALHSCKQDTETMIHKTKEQQSADKARRAYNKRANVTDRYYVFAYVACALLLSVVAICTSASLQDMCIRMLPSSRVYIEQMNTIGTHMQTVAHLESGLKLVFAAIALISFLAHLLSSRQKVLTVSEISVLEEYLSFLYGCKVKCAQLTKAYTHRQQEQDSTQHNAMSAQQQPIVNNPAASASQQVTPARVMDAWA